VQAVGYVPKGQGLVRSGAKVGDVVLVSGTLGDAAAGLHDSNEDLRERFDFPTPRVALGQSLLGIATAAMDVSDGLLADLGKLSAASGVGAALELECLPLSTALIETHGLDAARRLALMGGDDYELLFTLPPERWQQWQSVSTTPSRDLSACGITAIGRIEAGSGVRLTLEGGAVTSAALGIERSGWDHFE
jgi:thiamine-monophosphate kinase